MRGSIVTWTPPSVCLRADARAALDECGADAELVERVTAPETALRRAVADVAKSRAMVAGRINARRWQLSTCKKSEGNGGELEYAPDSVFEVQEFGRIDFAVFGESSEEVREAYTRARESMIASDVSATVQAIFRRSPYWLELIPLRDHGGVYFAPASADGMIERARAFVERVGGKFRSYRVEWQPGDNTERAIVESVAEHLYELVEEFRQSMVAAAECRNADAAIARRAARAADLRGQIKAYSSVLQSVSGDLLRKVEAAEVEAARIAAQSLREAA